MTDLPTLTSNQLDRAKNELERNHVDCPDQVHDGRLHDTYFFAKLDGNYDAHYCKTCGKTYTKKRGL